MSQGQQVIPPMSPAVGASGSVDKAHVLIVEDDRVSQRVLGQICESAGHRVLAVDSLNEAREELHRNVLFDLVFLDSHLGKDWGWEFLGELRSDALYRSIPVVVYTGHTERETLLQYIELGVQAVRAKPYKGEIVLSEVLKARQAGWCGRMFHSAEAVCERLRLSRTDYFSMLEASGLELERCTRELKTLLGGNPSARLLEALRFLKSQGNMIGVPALEQIAAAIQAWVDADEPVAAVRSLQRVDDIARLIKQRCAEFHGEGSSRVVFSRPSELAPELPPAMPLPPPPPQSAGSVAVHARKVASGPAWSIGKCFGRLQNKAIFKEEDYVQLVESGLVTQPMAGFLACVAAVEAIPNRSLDEARGALAALPDFSAPFGRIAEQLGVRSFNTDPLRNIERLGLERTLILIEAAKAASCALVESPLSLSHAMVHSVATGLIAHEAGRMLHLAHAHLLFPLGLLHDVGRWMMAVEEPGFYTIAIGLAQGDGTDMAMAERITFGLSQEELGLRLCRRFGLRTLFCDGIAHHGNSGSPDVEPGNRVSVAMIQLAMDLAYAAAAEQASETEQIKARLLADAHPSWAVLAQGGVSLPLSRRDLVEHLMTVAATSQWITMVLGSWAAGTRRKA